MKKNLSRLIAEVKPGSSRPSRGGFKLTCRNAHEYTNKILVDADEMNKPSNAERFIGEEMEEYQIEREE